ncbi:polysaccharide deacetylase family protein [Pseudomonas sp. L5B5]|uniref:polysaccharide deacetylase family protein n=1 Tax=Pseudomonas sp. L5B5 TaxID=2883205 RepID=UPI000730C560|nr:polysaccharide deacetylase family protein [Pseudomonas sp. L5B5]KTC26627.1 polysaccharide deacetylase [Pseudomonas sp. ABAC61]UCZ85316.1 polysaccharide deacetylase family protein [Pseudomonas sp. L5B5]
MTLKSTLKRLLGSAYLHSTGRARLGEAGVVLMLHRVLADSTAAARPHRAPLCVGQAQFEHLLRWLRRHFDCVPLQQLLDLPGGDRPRVALTFDDGWRDNAEVAYPVLERYEVPASIFLSTDFVGSRQGFWWESIGEALWQRPGDVASRPLLEHLRALQLTPPLALLQAGDDDARSRLLGAYLQRLKQLPATTLQALADGCPAMATPQALDWAQVKHLERSGLVSFGPHGASHAILTRLEGAALHTDLQRSHDALHKYCQAPLEIYCYPNGDHNPQVRAAVAGLGYRYGLGTRPGLIEAAGNPWLALPRIDVSHASAAHPGLLAWRLWQGARA